MYGQLIKALGIKHADVLNVYPFGSRVYGTYSYKSDHDFVIVGNIFLTQALNAAGGSNLIHGEYAGKVFHALVHDTQSFAKHLAEHTLYALECYFLPEDKVLLETAIFNLVLDKSKLRSKIITKAICDWEKAKQKFSNSNPEKGKKCLFHALRGLLFGIQLAQHGEIFNYTLCAFLWQDIKANPSKNWEDYEGLCKERFHAMLSQFKKETEE